MIARRVAAVLSVLGIVVPAAAGCTSSGKPHSSTSAPSAASLAADLQRGIAGIRTAQVSLDGTFQGQKITGSGPATFAAGRLTGLDLDASVPALGKLEVRIVDGKSYAKLGPPLNLTGKPWVLVSPSSANPIFAQIGSVLAEIQTAAGLNNLVTLVRAATKLTGKGSETVHGVSATHYRFTVDGSKLPSTFPGRGDFTGKLKDKPTDLWVDDTGRPVQAKRTVLALGQQVDVTVGASAFNSPVTITAPPASDVAGG